MHRGGGDAVETAESHEVLLAGGAHGLVWFDAMDGAAVFEEEFAEEAGAGSQVGDGGVWSQEAFCGEQVDDGSRIARTVQQVVACAVGESGGGFDGHGKCVRGACIAAQSGVGGELAV
jgi:hypothetical protein